MAMPDYVYLKGKASWAKVITPDVEYNTWSIKLYIDDNSYAEFMKLKERNGEVEGILNEVKTDEEGGRFVTLRRPMSRKWNGKETQLSAPVVLDKNNQPTRDAIGNGSDVTVKCELYSYKKPFNKGRGRAIRLQSVRVDNLVPYERKDMPPDQELLVKGMDAQPVEHF